MSRLTAGKVAVITGGSTGRGRHVARSLVNLGCKIVIGDTLDHEGQETVNSLNSDSAGSAIYLHTDTTVYKDVNALFKLAESEFGGVDIVVLDSGTIKPPDLEKDEVRIHKCLGLMKCARVAALHMNKRGGGVIVIAMSITGTMNPTRAPKRRRPGSGDKARVDILLANYSTTKHSVDGWMEVIGQLNSVYDAAAREVSPSLRKKNPRSQDTTPTPTEEVLQLRLLVPKLELLALPRNMQEDETRFSKKIVHRISALLESPDRNIGGYVASTHSGTEHNRRKHVREHYDRRQLISRSQHRVRESFVRQLESLGDEKRQSLRNHMENLLKDLGKQASEMLAYAYLSKEEYWRKALSIIRNGMFKTFDPLLNKALRISSGKVTDDNHTMA